MGFKPKRKVYRLRFAEDHDLHGLDVTMRSVTTGRLLDIQEAAGRVTAGTGGGGVDAGSFREMVQMVADALVSWNLEDDDDQPVPATLDGMLAQETDLIVALIGAWSEAVAGVSAPLDGPSSSGGTSPEASIPTELLSLNLAS